MEWILKLLGIDPVGKILDALGTAYKTKLTAANDAERIAAEVEIKRLETGLALAQQAKEIRLATAGFWEMRLLTAIIAGCFTLHLVAVTLDTVFKLGWKIFAYPPPFDQWEGAILLSFFGIYAGTKIATTAITAFATRRK